MSKTDSARIDNHIKKELGACAPLSTSSLAHRVGQQSSLSRQEIAARIEELKSAGRIVRWDDPEADSWEWRD